VIFKAGNAKEGSFQRINIFWDMPEARLVGVISTQSRLIYFYLYRLIQFRFLFLWRNSSIRA